MKVFGVFGVNGVYAAVTGEGLYILRRKCFVASKKITLQFQEMAK
jgi:hypothetical protein